MPEPKSHPLRVAAAWLIVLIPLGWGVIQSVGKSLPLFQSSASRTQNLATPGK